MDISGKAGDGASTFKKNSRLPVIGANSCSRSASQGDAPQNVFMEQDKSVKPESETTGKSSPDNVRLPFIKGSKLGEAMSTKSYPTLCQRKYGLRKSAHRGVSWTPSCSLLPDCEIVNSRETACEKRISDIISESREKHKTKEKRKGNKRSVIKFPIIKRSLNNAQQRNVNNNAKFRENFTLDQMPGKCVNKVKQIERLLSVENAASRQVNSIFPHIKGKSQSTSLNTLDNILFTQSDHQVGLTSKNYFRDIPRNPFINIGDEQLSVNSPSNGINACGGKNSLDCAESVCKPRKSPIHKDVDLRIVGEKRPSLDGLSVAEADDKFCRKTKRRRRKKSLPCQVMELLQTRLRKYEC